MKEYKKLLDHFVRQSREILGENLTGIYLHGSTVMGCFNPEKSDIDLIVVVREGISDESKRRYMDMVVALNGQAPAKGIELSVVRQAVCDPFVYPTPFELHFSITHLDWYRRNPEDYIEKMRGTDKDLAAHFTIIRHRGKTLYGKEIGEVFGEVGRADYFDSIRGDIENAEEEIAGDPVYMILNLCRVLAYKKEGLILSKEEGGQWGLTHVPKQYAGLICDALAEYKTGDERQFDKSSAKEYAAYMLEQIL